MAEQAQEFNWPTITAGDYVSEVFSFLDAEGNAVDISERTYRAEFRHRKGETGDAAAVADCQVSSPYVTVSLTPTQTRELADAGRRFVWDLEETSSEGNPVTVLKGYATTAQDVTR